MDEALRASPRDMGIRLFVALREDDHAPLGIEDAGVRRYEFDQDRVVVGRGQSADVRLPNGAVARRHAVFQMDGQRCFVSDAGSTNGTRVNGQRLVPSRSKALREGDLVDVGPFRIRFGLGPVNQTSPDRNRALARSWIASLRRGQSPRLMIENGPKRGSIVELPPAPARLLIGRGEHAQVHIDDADVSREHAELIIDHAGVLIRDCSSKNGLDIGGKRFAEKVLMDRDEIRLGATVLVFEDTSEKQLEESAAADDEVSPLADVVLEVVAEPPEASPEDFDPAALTGQAEPPPVAPTSDLERAPKRPLGPEAWVLGFALIVLVTSVIGLWWLLAG